jgi:hypothetical protein
LAAFALPPLLPAPVAAGALKQRGYQGGHGKGGHRLVFSSACLPRVVLTPVRR